ncbi:MAG TPA: hypothetical protein VEH47_04270, partial [Candidatus Acidoferrales bacterium]|nr:hypothetical protein [Candidatus Acidoferrales bacterium]
MAGTGKFDGGIQFGDGSVQTTAASNSGGSGGGMITAVLAGADLTGGGTSGAVTLNLNTTKVPQLNASNTFNAPNYFNSSNYFTGSSFFT